MLLVVVRFIERLVSGIQQMCYLTEGFERVTKRRDATSLYTPCSHSFIYLFFLFPLSFATKQFNGCFSSISSDPVVIKRQRDDAF